MVKDPQEAGSMKRRKEWRRNRYWTRSRSFGARLGLPKVDVDKLIDLQLKNIDAITQSAHVAGEGAKTLAAKQREIIDAAFKQTSDMVREFHPTGDPQEILAKQKDYAKKAFELTVQNTRDLADLTKKTTSDATTIVQDRLRSSLAELRDSVTRTERRLLSTRADLGPLGAWVMPDRHTPERARRIAEPSTSRLRAGVAMGTLRPGRMT